MEQLTRTRCLQGGKRLIKSGAKCLRSIVVPNDSIPAWAWGPPSGEGRPKLGASRVPGTIRLFMGLNLLNPLTHSSSPFGKRGN